CLRNAGAAAQAAARSGRDTVIVCAGTNGRLSLEDVACAAFICEELEARVPEIQWGDGARLVRGWFRSLEGPAFGPDDWVAFLADTEHGRRLASLGFDADLRFCARVNDSSLVPVLSGRWLVAPVGEGSG